MKPLIAIGTMALLSASLMPASAMTARNAIRPAGPALTPFGAVETLTKAFPTSMVRDMGVAPASTPMKLTIGLYIRNASLVNSILAEQNRPGSALYHKYLTPAQTKSLFSPTRSSVLAVESYLAREGFRDISVTDDNRLVQARGSVGTVNAAFRTAEHVGLRRYGKAILFNSRPAIVPAALGSTVQSVIGVHTVAMVSNIQKRKAGASCEVIPLLNVCALNDFTPRAFWVAYDAGGNLPGTDGSQTADYHSGINTPIAIFGEGILTGVVEDLRTQENLYNLPQTNFTIVPESGGGTQTDTSGSDEFDLDTQTSSGVAGNVKHLDIFDALSLDDSDLIVTYDQFVNSTDKAASASFGGCTALEELSGELPTEDGIFATAALQGQTIFASSGDTGTGCEGVENGVPAGVPGTEYPASSEYVIGVGGTSLITTPANLYQGEIPWAGAGGGLEPFETEGSWATSVATTSTVTGIRSVPDISMDADPNVSGADVTVGGATEIIGGTSLASPMALAVWARIESNNGEKYGFAGPVLYKEFGDDNTAGPLGRPGDLTQTVGGFNDIQVGTNVGYPAAPGYDLASGLGSLDIALQIQDIGN